MPKFTIPDNEILEAALVGLQKQLADVDDKIAGIRRRIGGRRGPARQSAGIASGNGRRRPLSAAARRRIAIAQKKRWAKFRKAHSKSSAS